MLACRSAAVMRGWTSSWKVCWPRALRWRLRPEVWYGWPGRTGDQICWWRCDASRGGDSGRVGGAGGVRHGHGNHRGGLCRRTDGQQTDGQQMVNKMISSGKIKAEYMAINTNRHVLEACLAGRKTLIGEQRFQEHSGARPHVIMEESADAVEGIRRASQDLKRWSGPSIRRKITTQNGLQGPCSPAMSWASMTGLSIAWRWTDGPRSGRHG